jgi:hypothetical protein
MTAAAASPDTLPGTEFPLGTTVTGTGKAGDRSRSGPARSWCCLTRMKHHRRSGKMKH